MKSQYDLVVIGAGITGAGIAWDAALRGISTLLVDKGDFGAETSAGCFKIAHGGLRYLQSLNFSKLKESAEEQLFIRKQATCFVKPFELLIPTKGFGLRSKLAVSSAVKFYEAICSGRNLGFSEQDQLSKLKLVTKGVLYGECYFTNSERFTYLIAKSAEEAGAEILNYTEASEISKSQFGWDVSLGSGDTAQARFLISATGQSWQEVENQRIGNFSKGLQAVVPRKCLSSGIVVSGERRNYFAYPWNGMTLIGTTDSVETPRTSGIEVSSEEIRNLLKLVNPHLADPVELTEVSWVFGGYRLLDESLSDFDKNEEKVDQLHKVSNRELIRPFREARNALSVVSVKYTTFRSLAEKVVDRVSSYLGSTETCSTKNTKVWSSPKDIVSLRKKVTDDYLVSQYGSLAEQMSKRGELRVLCEDKTVKTLEDLLFRRSILGFNLVEGELESLAQTASEYLGWTEQKTLSEVKKIKDLFSDRLPWKNNL